MGGMLVILACDKVIVKEGVSTQDGILQKLAHFKIVDCKSL